MSSADVLDDWRRYQSSGRALLFSFSGGDVVEAGADGSVVHTDGDDYLDFGSYSVFLLGHQHPAVVAAVTAQLASQSGSSRTLMNEVTATAAKNLAAFGPADESKVMFLNSGSEAVEAALKLVRARTTRDTVLHLKSSYHGKTLGALSLTDNVVLRERVGPLPGSTAVIPRDDAATAAQMIVDARPAAVFFEAVQGEGGVVVLSDDYLRAVAQACADVGALLVADEIQCGMGRCGTMWAFERSGIRPDVIVAGKALGGGVMPVSAVIASVDAFGPYDRDPFLHTTTFGGNPLAAAAVTAALGVVTEERVDERAGAVGERLAVILAALQAESPDVVTQVRGLGCLQGIEFAAPMFAGAFVTEALERNLLLTPCVISPTVVRVAPSAFVTGAQLDAAQAAMRGALEAVLVEYSDEVSSVRNRSGDHAGHNKE